MRRVRLANKCERGFYACFCKLWKKDIMFLEHCKKIGFGVNKLGCKVSSRWQYQQVADQKLHQANANMRLKKL